MVELPASGRACTGELSEAKAPSGRTVATVVGGIAAALVILVILLVILL